MSLHDCFKVLKNRNLSELLLVEEWITRNDLIAIHHINQVSTRYFP